MNSQTDNQFDPREVKRMMAKISEYWVTASGEPELKEFAEYVLSIISERERKAKEEQIMQDFISLTAAYLPDVDESEIIDWRDNQLAALRSQERESE